MSIVDDFNNSFGVQAVKASNAGSVGLPGEDTITAEVINRSRDQSKERILALTGEQKVNLGVGELNTSLFDNDDNVIDLTDNKQTINLNKKLEDVKNDSKYGPSTERLIQGEIDKIQTVNQDVIKDAIKVLKVSPQNMPAMQTIYDIIIDLFRYVD
jgi:hypothetical protein